LNPEERISATLFDLFKAAANDTSKEGPLLSLVSPARSLVARGVVDEAELK